MAGAFAGDKLGITPLGAEGGNTLRNYLARTGADAVSLMANAATRSAISGTSFGDNVLASLPDVIAQTVGDMVSYGVTSPVDEIIVNSSALSLAADRAFPTAKVAIPNFTFGDAATTDDFAASGYHEQYRAKRAAELAANQATQAADEGEAIIVSATRAQVEAAKRSYAYNTPTYSVASDGIKSYPLEFGAGYRDFYRNEGSKPGFAANLLLNKFIGTPYLNAAYAQDLIDRGDWWELTREVAPVLNAQAANSADIAEVAKRVNAHIVDRRAQVKPLENMFMGMIAAYSLPFIFTGGSGGSILFTAPSALDQTGGIVTGALVRPV